ncbi:GNAT family N-acetyltransferase [Clostridium algidicarnis]|uniref:GNAT family N-acetyltransferase n=1 Tax=Clostridium algidicarnis TaxID=37659 RepID=UPI0016255552|nr:GNAT family N-acetyltransferase [Clostridium algidicarnis]MBB6697101.1 GNAT family N-acetyltransferase [Clostridium algidicarnis]
MPIQPVIHTDNLLLRPFKISDSSRVKELAGDSKIATTTLNVPHPYEDGMAELWINSHKDIFINKKGIIYAIIKKDSNELIGTVALMMNNIHKKAELSYWIGVPYFNKGYCTESSKAIIEYGFKELNLNKIYALCMDSNVGSYRVMEKIGMKYEGTRKQDVIKNGVPKDLKSYAILKEEFNKRAVF